MAMTPRPWTVLDHDPVMELEPNLRAVSGRLPKGNMNRRMAVARRRDGRLVFFNAVPLREADMQALEAWGTPGFLIVPSGLHRLDLHAYKTRYPQLKVLAPQRAMARVREAVEVDGSWDAWPADEDLTLRPLPDAKVDEPILVVRSGERASLVFGDVLMNLPARVPGFDGFLFRLIGSTGGVKVTPLAKLAIVGKGKAQVRALLTELADLPGLARLVPSHGGIADGDNVPALLRNAANAL